MLVLRDCAGLEAYEGRWGCGAGWDWGANWKGS